MGTGPRVDAPPHRLAFSDYSAPAAGNGRRGVLGACLAAWETASVSRAHFHSSPGECDDDPVARWHRLPSIAVCAHLPDVRLRIVEALRGSGMVELCGTSSRLAEYAAVSRPAVALIHVHDAQVSGADETVRALRAANPAMAVVIYATLDRHVSRAICRLIQAGATDLAIEGFDDLGAKVRTALRRTGDGDRIADVLAEIERSMHPAGVEVVEYCLLHAHEPLSVPCLSRALGTTPRTLARRLLAAGMPSAGAIIVWCRLAFASHLLENPSRSVTTVAYASDFASPSAFRNQMQRYLGMRPNDVRTRGGLAFVLRAFGHALVQAASPRPERIESGVAGDEEPIVGADGARRRVSRRRATRISGRVAAPALQSRRGVDDDDVATGLHDDRVAVVRAEDIRVWNDEAGTVPPAFHSGCRIDADEYPRQ